MPSPNLAPDAEQLFESGRYDEALVAWRSIADADPSAIRPRARVGACLIALGRFAEALAMLEPLAAAAPDQPLVHYRLALARAASSDGAGLGEGQAAHRADPAHGVEAALDALDAAATAGLRLASGIDTEPAFDRFRGRARFAAIRARIAANDAPTATDPHFRAFDFWVGDWEARTADGVLQGHNRIEIVLGGAAIVERWTGITGFCGTSLNRYDRRTDHWRQTWIDDQGDVTEFEDGVATPGRMVFHAHDADGGLHRLTFVEDGPDAFRQTSEEKPAGGDAWTVEYDFLYRRAIETGG